MIRARRDRWAAGLAAVVLAGLAVVGCNKKEEGTQMSGPPPGMGGPPGGPGMGPSPEDVEAKLPGGAEFAAAKKVYAAQGCARCHKLGETGGPGGMMGGGRMPPGAMPPGAGGPEGGMPKGMPGGMMGGPDLTHVGAAAEHTPDWVAAHIRNAKDHKPESRMPAYGADKIPEADLKALAAYLAAQK